MLTGCYTWQPIQTVPLVLLAPDNPTRSREILVKTEAGGKQFLRRPRLSGDTVVGMLSSRGGREPGERRIPLDSILVIETVRFSGGATAGTLFLTTLSVVVVFVALVLANLDQNSCCAGYW